MDVLMEIRRWGGSEFSIRGPEQVPHEGGEIFGVFIVVDEHANKIMEDDWLRTLLCNVLMWVLKGNDATPDDLASSSLYKEVLSVFLPAAKAIRQRKEESTMLI